MDTAAAHKIKKAVFPVAGRGTRFLPVTKASPKEMLAVTNKPLIQYAVEEAYNAGIREMIFVTNHNKQSIENHFDDSYELESELAAHNDEKLLAVVKNVKPPDMKCVYVRQSSPLGLGHAVLCAEHLIGNEHFAVILADDLIASKTPVIKQMINLHQNLGYSNILAVEEVPAKNSHLYGIVEGNYLNNSTIRINKLLEKPNRNQSTSNLAIIGRYILSPQIFKFIKNISPSKGGELQLTDAIQEMLYEQSVYGHLFEGTRFDCGNKLGFLKANVQFGIDDSEIRDDFKDWLTTLISQ